jgi:hypothetical protein
MRFLILATIPLVLAAAPAMAQSKADPAKPDTDALCEATFTALSENAHDQGLSSSALGQGAEAAHRAWIAHHPGHDAGLYRTALKVEAASLRQAMHDGRITLPDTLHTLVNCHARYGRPQMVASVG